MASIRVVLVDDHKVVRQGLSMFLGSTSDIIVIGEASSGEEALKHIEQWLPDVVVMDLLMPGGIDGVEAIRRIKTITPHTQLIALTSYTDDSRVIAVLRAGAIGYVRKDAEPEVLVHAIRAAARGQSSLEPALAQIILYELSRSRPEQTLTERERDVLHQLALGRSNKDIASILSVSTETVKTHVGNILTKLHLSDRNQVMIYAPKHGLVTLNEIDLS